jgi:hypothetical protein
MEFRAGRVSSYVTELAAEPVLSAASVTQTMTAFEPETRSAARMVESTVPGPV